MTDETGLETETVQKIEDTRITYEDVGHGVRIHGNAFFAEFPDRVGPEAFCDDVRTAEDPWKLFGIKTQLQDDYWKVTGNLWHVEDEEIVDASPITFEVWADGIRIYVKEGCSAERAAEFVEVLKDEYDVEVTFADDE